MVRQNIPRQPLVCVLNQEVDIKSLEILFPKFDWCNVCFDFYGTLNAIDRIPDMFVTFADKPRIDESEINKLPMFMRSRWFDLENWKHFASRLPKFEHMFKTMLPVTHYHISNDVRSLTKFNSCAYDISFRRFIEMQYYEKPWDRLAHFWIDFSSSHIELRQFFSQMWPCIKKYNALARLYHDTSGNPLSRRQLDAMGVLEWQRHVPFIFAVNSETKILK